MSFKDIIFFHLWVNFWSISFLISVSFKLIKNSEKLKRPRPPSLIVPLITSLLTLSRLHPHKKLNVNVSIVLIKELEGLIRGMAK